MYLAFHNIPSEPWCEGVNCATPSAIPGENIEITNPAPNELIYGNRIRQMVNPDKAILVDRCWGLHRVKEVFLDCRYYVVTDEQQERAIRPHLKYLLERNILILSPAGNSNCTPKEASLLSRAAIFSLRQQIARTYFEEDGSTLVNSLFSIPGLTPEIMSYAGFRFVGDKKRSYVACFHYEHLPIFCASEGHVLVRKRMRELGSSSLNLQSLASIYKSNYEKYLPRLYSKVGKDITGRRFYVVMPEGKNEPEEDYCHRGVVVVAKDMKLPVLSVSEISSIPILLELRIKELKQYILSLTAQNSPEDSVNEQLYCPAVEHIESFNEQYVKMLRELIYLEHFSALYERFKKTLIQYKETVKKIMSIKNIDQAIVDQLKKVSAVSTLIPEDFFSENINPVIECCIQSQMDLMRLKSLSQFQVTRVASDFQLPVQGTHAFECKSEDLKYKYIANKELDILIRNSNLGLMFLDQKYAKDNPVSECCRQHEDDFQKLREYGVDLNGLLVALSEINWKLLDSKDGGVFLES